MPGETPCGVPLAIARPPGTPNVAYRGAGGALVGAYGAWAPPPRERKRILGAILGRSRPECAARRCAPCALVLSLGAQRGARSALARPPCGVRA